MVPAVPRGVSALALVQLVDERIDNGTLELPVLPRIAEQVLELRHDDSANAADFARIFHTDPGLASHMLRIANSPAYMPTMPVTSLREAIVRLGLRTVSDIAIAALVSSRLIDVPGYETDVEVLWRHAVASGAYATSIAKIRHRNVDSMFLCGLLHDIGKPMLLQAIVDIARELSIDPSRSEVWSIIRERHADVGASLAQRWGLPSVVSTCIEYTTRHRRAPSNSEEVMMTAGGALFATHLLQPTVMPEERLAKTALARELNLEQRHIMMLTNCKQEVRKVIQAMAR